MKAKAIEDGFYRGSRIRGGSVIEFSLPEGGKLPKWLVPVELAPAPKKPGRKPPQTFSEINAENKPAE